MDQTRHLIIGGGASGLAYANFLDGDDYLVLEADSELGGYCKTVVQDGFVWDYSGHFFHFKNPDIERYLLDRMPADEVCSIQKLSKIVFGGTRIDFPFQKPSASPIGVKQELVSAKGEPRTKFPFSRAIRCADCIQARARSVFVAAAGITIFWVASSGVM